MKKETLEKLKMYLDMYKTDYKINITDKNVCHINHDKKEAFLGVNEKLLLSSKEFCEYFIERKIFQLISEIYLYKQKPELALHLFELKNSIDIVFEVRDSLRSFTFPYGVKSENISEYEYSFLKHFVSLDYDEMLEREKLEMSYPIKNYIDLVEGIVKLSNLTPNLKFTYTVKDDNGSYSLGTYGSGTYGSGTITIHIGNIIYAYYNKENPYSSIEEYVEAVTIHELGHMDNRDETFEELRVKNFIVLRKSISSGNTELFEKMFSQYVSLILQEEKRAWNEGEKFYINDSAKEKFKKHKHFGLKKYIPFLRSQKEIWLKESQLRDSF